MFPLKVFFFAQQNQAGEKNVWPIYEAKKFVEKQTKTQEKISGEREREMEKNTRHRTYSGLVSICTAAFVGLSGSYMYC